MIVKKEKNNFGSYDFTMTDGGKSLSLLLTKGGLLAWTLKGSLNDNIFEITKENYQIYEQFEKLYFAIANRREYGANYYKEAYSRVFKDGVVIWQNDDLKSSTLKMIIEKRNEKYVINFIVNQEAKRPKRRVLFKEVGSINRPFNIPFYKMFHELQEYDPSYHQCHLEEYFYQKD